MSSARRHATPTGTVVLGVLLLFAALAGVAFLTEALRHPATVVPVDEPADAGDPRDEVHCPPAEEAGPEPIAVTSNDLYDCPGSYDGRDVRLTGEAVGALLRREGGTWTQLNDDAYAGDLGPLPAHREFRGGNAGVGVLLPHELSELIEFVGGPRARGDLVVVVGTYHQSDPDSGEVAVILAAQGEIIRPGGPTEQRPLRDRRVAGGLFALLALAVLVGERISVRSWQP